MKEKGLFIPKKRSKKNENIEEKQDNKKKVYSPINNEDCFISSNKYPE